MFKIAQVGKSTSGQTQPSSNFFNELERETPSRAVKLSSIYPEEFLEEKI